jgi:hypothetical protein
VLQDYVQAHKWFNLAAASYPASSTTGRDKAVDGRDTMTRRLTPARIAQAQTLAREWAPK